MVYRLKNAKDPWFNSIWKLDILDRHLSKCSSCIQLLNTHTFLGLTSPFLNPFNSFKSSFSLEFCRSFLSFSLASFFVASSSCLALSLSSSWRDNSCWPMGIEGAWWATNQKRGLHSIVVEANTGIVESGVDEQWKEMRVFF